MTHRIKKEHIKKSVLFELAIILGLLISMFISYSSQLESTCDDIRNSVLRLHVIANSDSTKDQALKLKVRDAMLETGATLFSGSVDVTTAKSVVKSEIDTLEKAAECVLRENGCNDNVHIEIGKSRFPTKTYGNITLPAGKYEAVRVIIGKGEGHNWWCVMFPPMCLPAAEGETELEDVLTQDGIDLVSSNPKYEIKFKIVEWYEWAKSKLVGE